MATKAYDTEMALFQWRFGQQVAEGLLGAILRLEGYIGIDPAHPQGGPDGGKDTVCFKDDKKWIGAAFFPTTRNTFSKIKKKFLDDFQGITRNSADGIAFVTNQKISVTERESLIALCNGKLVEIYHLDRIVSLLDQPRGYAVRLNYLDIEMSKEEQVAYFELFAENIFHKMESIAQQIITSQRSQSSIAHELAEIQRQFTGFFPSSHTIAQASAYLEYRPSFQDITTLISEIERVTERIPTLSEQVTAISNTINQLLGNPQDIAYRMTTAQPYQVTNIDAYIKKLHKLEQAMDRVLRKQQEVDKLSKE